MTRVPFKVLSVTVLVCALTSPVHAQPAPENKAAAEVLFREGIKQLEADNYAQACPKLAESQRLDPAVGTLLYLADCYERSGKVASAWATFLSAATAAKRANQLDREKIATDRAALLEPRLSRLTITVPPEVAQARPEIKRNDVVVGEPSWGLGIPVDPGTHDIVVTANGKRPWRTSVEVLPEVPSVNVVVDALVNDGLNSNPPPPVASRAQPNQPDGGTEPRNGSAQRMLGLAVGGAGVLGLTLGTVFYFQTKSTIDDVKSHCTSYPNGCDSEGLSLNDDAQSSGLVATLGFIGGGALLAGGAVLFFTAPSPQSKPGAKLSPTVGPGVAGLVMEGRF